MSNSQIFGDCGQGRQPAKPSESAFLRQKHGTISPEGIDAGCQDVAYPSSDGTDRQGENTTLSRNRRNEIFSPRLQRKPSSLGPERNGNSGGGERPISNPLIFNGNDGRHGASEICGKRSEETDTSGSEDIPNARRKLLESSRKAGAAQVSATRSQYGDLSNWWDVEPDVGRVVDGLSTELDETIRRLGYAHLSPKKAFAKVIRYRRRVLRIMWERYQYTKAPPRSNVCQLSNCLPEVSRRDSYEGWILGARIEEDQELRDLWQRIRSEPFKKTHNLQQALLVRIGKKERTQKMASERVNRLKALGNAVVPQVAEWIGRRIIDFDKTTPP